MTHAATEGHIRVHGHAAAGVCVHVCTHVSTKDHADIPGPGCYMGPRQCPSAVQSWPRPSLAVTRLLTPSLPVGRAGPGVLRVDEQPPPPLLTHCDTQKCRPCTSPGQHSRAGTGGKGIGELAPRAEQERAGPAILLCGDV